MSIVSSSRAAASAIVSTAGLLGVLFAPAREAHAQHAAPHTSAWELRFTSGGLVATGAQRDVIKDAQLSAVQVSWLVHPAVAITGTVGWARSRDRLSANTPKLDVFTSDLGAELRPAQWFADRAVSVSPFIGAGAGARSYNYRSLDADATHNVAGYVAAGGEVGVGRVGVRLEVRDYASGFKPLVGAGTSEARNDIVLMAGIRFNRHRNASR
jgi:hypothetical protein